MWVNSIVVTLRCTAQCAHCGIAGHPDALGRIDEALARRSIDASSQAGYGVVELTGGEPILELPLLLRLIEHARAAGIESVSVASNGYWAETDDKASSVVSSLLSAGLTDLRLSTDFWHQRYTPLASVARAVQAAESHGLDCAVYASLAFPTPSAQEQEAVNRASRAISAEIYAQPVLPAGRGASLVSWDAIPPLRSCFAGTDLVTLPTGEIYVCHMATMWHGPGGRALCVGSAGGDPDEVERAFEVASRVAAARRTEAGVPLQILGVGGRPLRRAVDVVESEGHSWDCRFCMRYLDSLQDAGGAGLR